MLSGPVTALPLALFANAAHKLNLFVLGLLEYIAADNLTDIGHISLPGTF